MSELAENILRLRDEGKTYLEIKEQLGCSLGTVGYHLGEKQKEKSTRRKQKQRDANPLEDKIVEFRRISENEKVSANLNEDLSNKQIQEKLRQKRLGFTRPHGRNSKRTGELVDHKAMREKIESNPICYLTGRPIDLSKPRTYSLDHIIPRSKGGDNSVNNLGLTAREANKAKSDLTLDEFLTLCYDVLVYHGVVQPDTA